MWIAIACALSSTAHGDNCESKDEARRDGGTACADVSASFGSVTTWFAPDLNDLRAELLRIALYNDGPASWRFIGADIEMLPSGTAEGAYTGSVIGFGYGADLADWGWYAMGHLVTRAADSVRLVTPSFGLRLGRFDRAALVGEARFDGVRLLDLSRDAGPSVARDFDLRLRATAPVARWLRVEARGRMRDVTMDQRHVRDMFGIVGAQLAVADHDFRVLPVFIGAGVRRVLADDDFPMTTWQLVLSLEVDFGVNSSAAVW